MAGTVVRTGGGNPLGFFNDQNDFVRPEIVVVDGQEPPPSVQILQKRYVDQHRRRSFGQLVFGGLEVVGFSATSRMGRYW